MKFKIGDKVKYVSGEHGEEANNPVWNGKYGKVIGTINGEITDYRMYPVKWSNGQHNSYYEFDLELVERPVKTHPLTKIFK